jgi:hypothetical protein
MGFQALMRLRSIGLRAAARLAAAGLLRFLLIAATTSAGYGQRITSRIVGVVTDPSGAVVANAAVTGTNRGTGISFQSTTNAEGYYVLPSIPAGEYVLSVRVPGFRDLERSGILLGVDQTVRVDLHLELGNPKETVSVVAEVPRINSENVALQAGVGRQQITDLPINTAGGRSILDFMLLGAGVASPAGDYGNNNYSINGSPENTQVTVVDGTIINILTGHWYVFRPAVEEVSEIKVQSGTFSPESGGLAAINIATISGSNQFHGTAFYFYSGDNLAARGFFQATKTPWRRNQEGGTFTGPLIRNHTFFAFNYDRQGSTSPLNYIATVPVEQFRGGSFQGVGNIFDPATTRPHPKGPGYIRDPFPGNQIPADRMDPVSVKLMQYWPRPNYGTGTVNNFNNQLLTNERTSTTQLLWSGSLKIDQKLSERNQMFGKLLHNGGGYTQGVGYPGLGDYYGARRNGPYTVVTIGDTHSASPRAVNEFRFGYVHGLFEFITKAYNQNIAGKVGLPNVSGQDFPFVSIGGALPMTLGPGNVDGGRLDRNYQINDTFTYIRGLHIVKFGGNYIDDMIDQTDWGRPSGQFTFSGTFTNDPQVAGAQIGFADFLLGLPSSVGVSVGSHGLGYRKPRFGLFVSDDVKAARNLTMNLGLRWDVAYGVSEIHNKAANFNPHVTNPSTNTPGSLVFAGTTAPKRFSDVSKFNISPRAGLAYTFRNRTALRAGYSINYYPSPLAYLQPSNLGFLPSQILTTTDQITPVIRIRIGPPPLNLSVSPTPAVGNGQNVIWIPFANPSVTFHQWSLSVQRELPARMFVDIAYSGSRGLHLWYPKNINQVPTALLGPGDAQSRRPFPQYQAITLQDSDGMSKYHALQTTLTRRFANRLGFSANYTFSRATDNTSYDFFTGAPYQNVYNLRAEWARSAHDTPHTFNFTASYELPELRRGKFAGRLTGGWQINSVVHAYTGYPFNVVASSNQSGALGGTLRPNRLRDGSLPSSQRSLSRWFDVGAFALPEPYTFGNSGRNVLRGPGFWQADLSVFKNIHLHTKRHEGAGIQFRLEMFNAFNHPNFYFPNAAIGSPAAGTITSTGYSGPRGIALGVRFLF